MTEPTSLEEVIDARITAALKSQSITLADLPMQKLQDKLELDWQPQGSVLLEDNSVTADKIAPPEAWTAIGTFVNGWRIYNGVTTDPYASQGFYKDNQDQVHLSGLIDKNGGNWVANEAFFTLPAGYRPLKNQIFTVMENSNGGASYGTVYAQITAASGVVQLGPFGGAANPVTWLSLAGISFRAEQ